MRPLRSCIAASILAVVIGSSGSFLLAGQGATATAGDSAAGWIALFDGRSLDQWRGYRREDASNTRWTVNADGTLCVVPGTGPQAPAPRDIVSKATYDEFELRWEWRVAEGGNSGLKYFVLEDQDSAIGHEYQMIDDARHPDAKRGPTRQTAALYDVLGAEGRPVRPAGEWNQSRVIVAGTRVEHWLNGAKVLEYELGSDALKAAIARSKFAGVARFGLPQKAHILLQDHGEVVCYRNIAIKPARP